MQIHHGYVAPEDAASMRLHRLHEGVGDHDAAQAEEGVDREECVQQHLDRRRLDNLRGTASSVAMASSLEFDDSNIWQDTQKIRRSIIMSGNEKGAGTWVATPRPQ